MDILDEIYEYVNNEFELDIKDGTRKRDYVEARALFYFLARKKTNYSYECISGFLNKNHATAIHAVKNIVGHLDEETIAEALNHFGLFKDIPRDTIGFLKRQTIELQNELKIREATIKLVPRLEDISAKLKYLTEEQRQKVFDRNNLQFESIGKYLDEVDMSIGLTIEGK